MTASTNEINFILFFKILTKKNANTHHSNYFIYFFPFPITHNSINHKSKFMQAPPPFPTLFLIFFLLTFLLLQAQAPVPLHWMCCPPFLSCLSKVDRALGSDYLSLGLYPFVRLTLTRTPSPRALAPLAFDGTCHL